MRAAVVTAAFLAVSSSFAGAHARSATATAEAVFKVGFPRGNPFAKLPALEVVELESQKVVATVRAKEWTPKQAVYEAALAPGKTYELRWAQPGEAAVFAALPIDAEATGSVIFRIPYVPRAKKPAGAPLASAGLARLAP